MAEPKTSKAPAKKAPAKTATRAAAGTKTATRAAVTKAAAKTAVKAVSGKPSLSLDDLSEMTSAQLGKLYAKGKVPADFKDLGRKPKGRMLAINNLDNRVTAPIVSTVAKVPFFPWDGKSMAATTKKTGDGINRINLGLRMNWFPFKTRVVKSQIDGRDTIYLDYEQKGNPIFIKKIRDELREIEPGLFLGPAMWKTGKDTSILVLWFALDNR